MSRRDWSAAAIEAAVANRLRGLPPWDSRYPAVEEAEVHRHQVAAALEGARAQGRLTDSDCRRIEHALRHERCTCWALWGENTFAGLFDVARQTAR
jgi:hypothetical protein